MSAVFTIEDEKATELFWCQSDNAWSIMGYFRDIIDGKISKTENTTLHYYYAEDERKLFGNSFVGDISYEDLVIWYKKIEKAFNEHENCINNYATSSLINYVNNLDKDTALSKLQVLHIKQLCENALLVPEEYCDIFSTTTKFTYEFWEFVEDMYDSIRNILECHKQSAYKISFTY